MEKGLRLKQQEKLKSKEKIKKSILSYTEVMFLVASACVSSSLSSNMIAQKVLNEFIKI